MLLIIFRGRLGPGSFNVNVCVYVNAYASSSVCVCMCAVQVRERTQKRQSRLNHRDVFCRWSNKAYKAKVLTHTPYYLGATLPTGQYAINFKLFSVTKHINTQK